MAMTLCRFPGPEQLLPGVPEANPRKVAWSWCYFIDIPNNVKSMTHRQGIFLQEHINYIK